MDKLEALHRNLLKYVSQLSDEQHKAHYTDESLFDMFLVKIVDMFSESAVDRYAFGQTIHQISFMTYRKVAEVYLENGNRKNRLSRILQEC
jgi:hypothetical protein